MPSCFTGDSVQNVELLPLSKKACSIIEVSLPLRLTFTGTIAMPVLGRPAAVTLHKVSSVLTMPLCT